MKSKSFTVTQLTIITLLIGGVIPQALFAQTPAITDSGSVKLMTISRILNIVDSPTPKITGGCISLSIATLSNSMMLMAMDVSGKNETDSRRNVEINILKEKLRSYRDSLADAADNDNKLFQRFLSAYQLPHGTPAEKKSRDSVIHRTLIDATNSPLAAAALINNILSIHNRLTALVAQNVRSDVLAGAVMLDGAFHAIIIIADDNINRLNSGEKPEFQKKRNLLVQAEKDVCRHFNSQ
jgi:formiminotetrahydrofolate cyclodeaminase